MQFESLKVFCDVARQRSFSEAAAANDLTQSAVSQLVGQLEKRLGVRLVDRSRRPLTLTREGQVYYDGCRKLVEQYQAVEAQVRTLNTGLASSVKVAAIYSVGLRDLNQVLERFRAENPGTEVGIEYLHPDKVLEKVLDGTADFGLVSFPQASRKLTALPWREEEMVVTCAPSHPFARRRSVPVRALDGQKYVGFDRDLVIRRKVDRFLRANGVAVDVVLEFDNIENIKQAIEISAGVALLPRPTLRRELASGALAAVPLADVPFVRPLGIVHRRSPGPGPMARQFLDLLLRQPDEPAVAVGPSTAGALQPRGSER
ncbi:MAG TPA: LysR family transcriptional regulator [Planctomycetota bacterium]|nr:LysR family transcriptional regulator [Planctomycetota bacterium]